MLDLEKPLVLSDGRRAEYVEVQAGDIVAVDVNGVRGLFCSKTGRPLFLTALQLGRGVSLVNEAPVSAAADKVLRDLVDKMRACSTGNGVDVSETLLDISNTLARTIGYETASPETLAARSLASAIIERIGTGRVRLYRDQQGIEVDEAAMQVAAGKHDKCDIMNDMLAAIEKGREIERASWPTPKAVSSATPNRLTITVDGPDGPGKTAMAEMLSREFPQDYRPMRMHGTYKFDPRIIEMRDGRPFDVRDDSFVAEAA